ncbi:tetratricopeptide repeat protein [Bradyrhizobium guangzhouense]|uniref:Tetratricopeptide repeat protein n=2 Tax=Bradyrhizobium guangzhouense TaxID=1325095 RepID=A0ABY0E9M1_9BRAD|nr:tetratricopeptide repeat protein [Bradyrhizobium guangzhouense]RXH17332.1 tetratricopeptide repeat protein [Bradyrhizobium guangzhouense]
MPLTAKCNAVGNFSVDDRIAGCTAIIEATTAMPQGVVMAHFRRAMFYRQKGEIDLAAADYDQIIERYPDNLNARLARASVHLQKQELEAALSNYGKVIELDPKNVYAYLGRAYVYTAKGDYVRAISDYDQALLIHPENLKAHVDRGLAYIRNGDPDRGMADCDRAVEISPQTGAGQLCRGRVYLAKGNKERALAELDQTMPIKPTNGAFYFYRARLYWQMASFAKSLADLDQSVQLNPKYAYPALWHEIVARRSDQPSQLTEAVKQLDMTKWPAPIVNLFLGTMTPEQVLSAADDPNPAKKKAQVCEANFYIAERALQSGSKEEALKLFDQAAADCPNTFIEKQAADAEVSSLRASH